MTDVELARKTLDRLLATIQKHRSWFTEEELADLDLWIKETDDAEIANVVPWIETAGKVVIRGVEERSRR